MEGEDSGAGQGVEGLHPPPSPREELYKRTTVLLEKQVLEEKMRMFGYTNTSEFVRVAVENYAPNRLGSEVAALHEKIDRLAQDLCERSISIPLEGRSKQRELAEAEFDEARTRKPPVPSPGATAQLPVQGSSDNVEVVRELAETIERLGDIKKMLVPAGKGGVEVKSEEELERAREEATRRMVERSGG
jgi:hypothetical protein